MDYDLSMDPVAASDTGLLPDPESTLKEASRIARSLRRRGMTFRRIAAELGVSVHTVQRWVSYRAKKKASPKRQKKPKPEVPIEARVSHRRKLFAQGLAEGKTVTEAGLAAGCPTAKTALNFSYRARNNAEFLEYFQGILEKAGLDEATLARKLSECTDATKVAAVATNKEFGIISDKLVVPDYHVRHQAIRTAFELHQRIGQRDQATAPGAAPIHLHVTLEQKREFEQLIGGPLAFDVITIPSEEVKADGNVSDGANGPAGGSAQLPALAVETRHPEVSGGDDASGGGVGAEARSPGAPAVASATPSVVEGPVTGGA